MLRRAVLASCLLLAACAGQAPREPAPATLELRLSPASLGRDLALQQQLSFRYGQEQRTFDALLEADSHDVKLEIQAMGQSAMRLQWDGKKLDQQRAPWLPKAVRGEEILSDLQLANWPIPAIRAALPMGWSLVENGATRELRKDDATVVTVRYPAPDRIEIEHSNFRLSIVSAPVQ